VSSTQEYKDVMRDIDAIAVQLKRLQTAGVPVLWRPLHEAGGTWFWWGAKGANVAKTLYYMMYDRLTNYHQLNNLIWVWSSPEPDWYPGNDKVDMIGYDSYPGAYNYSSQKAVFNQLYSIVNGEKLIALTETGPIPNINQSLADDVPWLYFLAWNDLVASQNSTAHIQEVYNQGCNLSSLLTGTYEEENSFKTEFKIYPNPFTKSAIVELKSLETLPLQLSISNANGQLVYITDKHFTNEKIILPAELPLGMLWLKVSYGNNYANVFKMVKTE
jgi:mannan endo-1,4-beta-mannosidase